jgi:hypothetical protein
MLGVASKFCLIARPKAPFTAGETDGSDLAMTVLEQLRAAAEGN